MIFIEGNPSGGYLGGYLSGKSLINKGFVKSLYPSIPLPVLGKPVFTGFFDFEEGYLVCYYYLHKITQNQIYPFILKFSHICTNIKETIISTIVVMVLAI